MDWNIDKTFSGSVAPSHRCKQRLPGSEWRYLWSAVDANGQMVDFPLTARRDTKAARAFMNRAIEHVHLHRPATIVTNKVQAYRRVIREINNRSDPHFESIRRIDTTWRNNLIDGDHSTLKRLLGYYQSFRFLGTASATISGIETTRTIKPGHILYKQPGFVRAQEFIDQTF